MAMMDVAAALTEVQEKTQAEIEAETARAWGARAVACFLLFKTTGRTDWFMRAEHYRGEALEHAAMVDDNGLTVQTISGEMSACGWR